MDEETTAESGPTDIAERVRARLQEWQIPHRIMEIDPNFADTAAFCEKYGHALENSVNCILVVGKTQPRRYAACLVQAVRRLDVNHTVRGLLEARKVSFASAADTVELTGMTPGGVTPVALPADLPVFVDAPVAALDEIILGSGDRAAKLFVSAEALLAKLPRAQVVEGLTLDT